MSDETSTEVASRPSRLGCVSYLNTLPLIEGLGKTKDARLTLTPPSGLADLLVSGEVDVALASVIDYQRAPEALVLCPVGMIGCDGPTLTVRLFSSVPIDDVRRVHCDVDSHTSLDLLRVLLHARTGEVPTIEAFDADAFRASREEPEREDAPTPENRQGWPEALLLIGDKVVSDSPPAILYPHQLDLGEAWHELTGLPFVYAMWMCRERDAESAEVRRALGLLDRTRRHNATRTDWIVAQRAPLHDWPRELASAYVKNMLRYEVGEREREAVERFFDLAHAAGVIDERRATRWAG